MGVCISFPGSSGPRGQDAQALQKADWLHILKVLFPFPSIRGKDFPLSLIPTVGNREKENKLRLFITPEDNYFA